MMEVLVPRRTSPFSPRIKIPRDDGTILRSNSCVAGA
jgi:hypothetical protein